MISKKLGIVGGGQLACLLFQAAQKLRIPTLLFVEGHGSPAVTFGYAATIGSVGDQNFKKFMDSVDVVTFENEWIAAHELQKYGHQKEFYPRLATLEALQDKISQKEILSRLHIPTAAFEVFDSAEPIIDSLEKARKVFGPFILKWSRYGYDGKGVCFSDEAPSALMKFCEEALSKNARVYAEAEIPFKKELALVCARGKSGDFFAYPLVKTQQKSGVCEWVFSDPDISEGEHKEAQMYAKAVADHLDYVGVLAIEFFFTPEGTLMVNEMAPRVHNSSHYSLTASSVSQFENHIRAVMGLDILPAQNQPFFAMLNLLGPELTPSNTDAAFSWSQWNGFDVYWYGKKEVRPLRKMGHVNISAANEDDFNEMLKRLKEHHQKWIQDISR